MADNVTFQVTLDAEEYDYVCGWTLPSRVATAQVDAADTACAAIGAAARAVRPLTVGDKVRTRGHRYGVVDSIRGSSVSMWAAWGGEGRWVTYDVEDLTRVEE